MFSYVYLPTSVPITYLNVSWASVAASREEVLEILIALFKIRRAFIKDLRKSFTVKSYLEFQTEQKLNC